MSMRIPIFFKLTIPLILLITITVGLSGYLVYTESTQRWQAELDTRLDRVANLLATTVDVRMLLQLRDPVDIDTPEYRAVQRQLQQALTAANLARISIFYRDRDQLYYWVDTNSTGVGYPFLYATPEHNAAFIDRAPQRVEYADEFGSYYGMVVPIVIPGPGGAQVVGIIEAAFTQESRTLVQRSTLERVVPIVIGGSVVAMGLAALITIALFNRPLRRLQRGALTLAGGHFGHTIEMRASDELGDLAHAFNVMSGQLERLYRERADNERAQRELEIAHNVQQALFPKGTPRVAGVELAAVCRPHRETSGDFYDLIVLSDGRLGIVIGDVSGKSIPAAMLMVLAYSTIRSEAFNHISPALVLSEANAMLAHNVPRGMFVAASYALFDLHSREMIWANAGQLAPVLLDNGHTNGAPPPPQYLETTGAAFPLGIITATTYSDQRALLQPGSTVLFFTDGVVEAMNPARELYGFERLEELVRTLPPDLSPQALIDAVLTDVAAFVGPAEQHDDITLIAVKIGHGTEQQTTTGVVIGA